MFDSFGFTIFCEDIRDERDGRNSYIGVFQDSAVFPSFPSVLPKLGIDVLVVLSEDAFFSKATFNVYFPGGNQSGPDFTFEKLSTEEDQKLWDNRKNYRQGAANSDPDILRTNNIRFRTVFSPVVLLTEGLIKIRVDIDGIICKAGALRVESIQSAADRRLAGKQK